MNTFSILTKEQLQKMTSFEIAVYMDALADFCRLVQNEADTIYREKYSEERKLMESD